MKISIIVSTCFTRESRSDPWKEAIRNYLDVADEVVVVYGIKSDAVALKKEFRQEAKLKIEYLEWLYDFKWTEIAKHYNKAMDLATGDIILKCDIDYFMHKEDFEMFRQECKDFLDQDRLAGTLIKFNVLNRKAGMIKSRNPIVLNGKRKDKIEFGNPTPWTVPILKTKDGLQEIKDYYNFSMWVYNYDYFFYTKEQVAEEFLRFSLAKKKVFKSTIWGETKEEAFKAFKKQMEERIPNAKRKFNHPEYIVDRIKKMKPNQFGYNNFDFNK